MPTGDVLILLCFFWLNEIDVYSQNIALYVENTHSQCYPGGQMLIESEENA
jgi:hypothetical protein